MSSCPKRETEELNRLTGTCILLAALVFIVFVRTLQNDFVNYDDGLYFSANPHVQAGLTWPGVKWAFQTTRADNWHPVTWLSLMVDAGLFGRGPGGPHLTNLMLHAANVVLLFLLLRRMTGAHWRSAVVASLFALHPLRVESVAWVAERKDLLSGFFFMLTLLMYARYAEERSRVEGRRSGVETIPAFSPRRSTFAYAAALLFFVLGLMSKPMLVTLPFVLLLLDYWPLGRFAALTSRSRLATARQLILEKLPFFALSAASSVVTLLAQQGAVQPLAHIGMGIRAVNAVVSWVRYLDKMIWPVNLAVLYPYRGYWPAWIFGLCAGFLLASSLVALRCRRRFPFFLTGWFWYVGMLVPVIGLVQVGMQSIADRYTYLPLIGVFILLVWGVGELRVALRTSRAFMAVMVAGTLVMLGACAALTVRQIGFWKNSETLFRHTIAVTGNNDVAEYNLGEYYCGKNRLEEAIPCYLEAIRLRPAYDDALNNLGVALAMRGDLAGAAARIREAIRYRPDKADAHYNLGNVLAMQHKMDEAADAYLEALRLKPDYPEAHNNLANVLLAEGHRQEAIQHYREALLLDPNHQTARRRLQALGALPPK